MPLASFSKRSAVVGVMALALGLAATSQAQVQPNPPSSVLVDDGGDSRGNPLFFDDFNYAVNREDAGGLRDPNGLASARFLARGWSSVKREPTDTAGGFIYTTTSIPGYSGRMPGLSGSGRVLALEGRPTSVAYPRNGLNQTDFYLQYGGASSTSVPSNIWYQFWFYINDYGTQQSRWGSNTKLIYPSPNGSYGVPTGQLAYLIQLGSSSYETDGSMPLTLPYNASRYITNRAENWADFQRASEYPTNRSKLGPNVNRNAAVLAPNRWHLIKIHIDHSGPQGTYEMWTRQMGGSWQKLAEWIGGVTPNFLYPTIEAQRAGLQTVRIPTTWGTASSSDTTNYDAWTYMADFAISRRESDLPTYGSY